MVSCNLKETCRRSPLAFNGESKKRQETVGLKLRYWRWRINAECCLRIFKLMEYRNFHLAFDFSNRL